MIVQFEHAITDTELLWHITCLCLKIKWSHFS